MWDPQQYQKFAEERARPFHDLLAQVRPNGVRTAVDLGCGPGELTRGLADRWPGATVTGVDNAPEMLERTQALAILGRLCFIRGDIASWQPEEPVELLVSNAALQWVWDHEVLLPRLAGMVAPGGTLAVQMPTYRSHRTPSSPRPKSRPPSTRSPAARCGLQPRRQTRRPPSKLSAPNSSPGPTAGRDASSSTPT